MSISLILLIISFGDCKNPISAPGDVNITNLLDSDSITLPDGSIFTCQTADIDAFVSESADANTLTTTSLTVDKIIALDTELLFSGKFVINGEITYSTSLLETKQEQFSNFLDSKPVVANKLNSAKHNYSSFLEINVPQ